MFVYVAHKKLIPVFFRKNIRQVEAGTSVSRLMCMIANGLDVVIHIGVYILLALLVIDAPLYDMKKVRNDTASSETLTHVIKIKTPWVRKTLSKYFEFLSLWMETPDSTVYKLTVLVFGARTTNTRLSKYSMTPIQPTIRTPYETIEGFMTVLNTPTIQQDFMRSVGFIVTIGIGNKN